MTKAKERRAYEQKLRVDAATVAIHGKIANLKEGQFYPAHDKRTESPDYRKVHKDLVVTQDLPCLVCGVRNSTLKNKSKNPHGAKQLETHHHIIEWALANAIDRDKFNNAIRPNLAHRHADNALYAHDMTAKQIHDWVDHSADNLWVAANQADEIVVVDPTGRAIAKLGDFEGLDPSGMARGLLFPASLVFSNGFVYVTNLALDLKTAVGALAVDSAWAAAVKRFNVARIRAQIPPVHGF